MAWQSYACKKEKGTEKENLARITTRYPTKRKPYKTDFPDILTSKATRLWRRIK